MSTSKEDVTSKEGSTTAQATKRRATLRRWITVRHQALAVGINPGKSHQPAITRQAVESIGGELILYDADHPDDQVEEYVNKLQKIKQLLDEQEQKQQQLQQKQQQLQQKQQQLQQKQQQHQQQLQQQQQKHQQLMQKYRQEIRAIQLQTELLRVDNEAALIEQAKAKTAAATTTTAQAFKRRATQCKLKQRAHSHIAQPDPPKSRPVHHRASSLINAGPERSSTLSECALCTGSHRTIHCNSFTVEKRRELAAKKKLCPRCLGNHHQLYCLSPYVCPCDRPHSRILCSLFARNNSCPNSLNINLNAESDDDDTASRTSPQQTIPKTFASTDSEEEEETFTATTATTTTIVNNKSTETTSALITITSSQSESVPKEKDAKSDLTADGKPAEYRFTSVPVGTSASPSLLYACMSKSLPQVAPRGERSSLPEVAHPIQDLSFADDLQLSLQSTAPKQITTIEAEWAAGSTPIVKPFGHLYSTTADTVSLQVDLPLQVNLSTITKRLFSSLLARIYDPLGLVSPYIIQLRLFLQKVWQLSLDWDDPLPDDLREEALLALRDTKLINTFSLQRHVLPLNGQASELFVYSDASKLALKAVAYSLVDGKTRLLISKFRLVHLTPAHEKKKDTIAALELDGLVMATRSAPSAKYRHVSTKENPADLITRNRSPNDLLTRPTWCYLDPPSMDTRFSKIAAFIVALISRGCSLSDLLANPKWFHSEPPSEDIRFSEKITTSIATAMPVQSSCNCSRFANYGQALNSWRRIARVFRRALKNRPSSLPDIALGRILLIKYLQHQHCSAEVAALGNQQQFDQSSVLLGRKRYLDEDGILRLYTRLLAGENLTLDQVKPIILPSKCHLVELFIQFEHQRLGHPGIERTMFAVRDQFFTLGARKYVHRLVSTCMMCKRLCSQTTKVDFGMVPQFRYDFGCTPFTNVGLDIYGPLRTAMTAPGKRYGVIFSCATTRVVHLEPIHDQTQESVFQAVLNFMVRRGIPHRIYTDNGKNLMAVKKQFVHFLNQLSTTQPGLSLHVEWIQLTVASLWRSGFYERLIRIIKDTLMALTFGKKVTNEELTTTLYQIEARLNSRPLFVYEGQIITPSHFSARRSLMQIPPIGSKAYSNLSQPKLIQRYKAMQSHVNAVWNTWYSQYLLTLCSFHQNLFEPNQADRLRVGDAVLLKNPTPSETWPFGIVKLVIKSEDGTIRTVLVRTHDRRQLTVKA